MWNQLWETQFSHIHSVLPSLHQIKIRSFHIPATAKDVFVGSSFLLFLPGYCHIHATLTWFMDWLSKVWLKTPNGVSIWNSKELNESVAVTHELPGEMVRWPNTACSLAVSMIPKQKPKHSLKSNVRKFGLWEMLSCVPLLRGPCSGTLLTLPATWVTHFPSLLTKM